MAIRFLLTPQSFFQSISRLLVMLLIAHVATSGTILGLGLSKLKRKHVTFKSASLLLILRCSADARRAGVGWMHHASTTRLLLLSIHTTPRDGKYVVRPYSPAIYPQSTKRKLVFSTAVSSHYYLATHCIMT